MRERLPLLLTGFVLTLAISSSLPVRAHRESTAPLPAGAQEPTSYREAVAQADAALKRRSFDEALGLDKRANSLQNDESPDALVLRSVRDTRSLASYSARNAVAGSIRVARRAGP